MNEDIKSLMSNFNITLDDVAKKLNVASFHYKLNNHKFNLTEKTEMKKIIQEIAKDKIKILESQNIEEIKKEFVGKTNIEIRAALKFNGISQREFANHIHIAPTSFCRKMRKEIPAPTTKLYIAEINKIMAIKKQKINKI